jgi:hypothetical protein
MVQGDGAKSDGLIAITRTQSVEDAKQDQRSNDRFSQQYSTPLQSFMNQLLYSGDPIGKSRIGTDEKDLLI